MEQEIKTKLEEQAKKLEEIYISVEKSRKYFLITMWITVLVIVLPMIGIAILAPAMLNTYTSVLGGM